MAQKQLLDWLWKRDKQFTVEEVKELIGGVKEFNAGAIDALLTKHVDKVFEAWLKKMKEKKA